MNCSHVIRSCLVWLASVACLVGGILNAADPVAVTSPAGMVVSVSPPASDIGAEILKQGGNAVDAAIAVALAMEVTWPEAGNIGGGGFMMIRPSDGRPTVCVEYRETAPAAATPEMFTIGESRLTLKVVGVPGTVRGLELARKEYGTLPWSKLIAPAVRLARDGFEIDRGLALSMNRVLEMESSRPLQELYKVYGKRDGTPWKGGDKFVQPDLANTLTLLAEYGPDAFYVGPVADLLLAEMKAGGGLITAEDLANYQAKIRTPIQFSFKGYEIFGAPPPSSGGLCLAEMFGMVDQLELGKQDRWSPETVHLLAEISRRAFLDRARSIGDPDFTEIPDTFTNAERTAELARGIQRDRATPSRELAADIEIADESPSTTHFSVIDKTGMTVSNTYTLEASWGSRIVVRNAGFLLNNEMGDFNWKPGYTDTRGNIGTSANVIAPGKRMLSSQTPVIVTRDGEVVLATGSPGGRTIINTVFCVLVNSLVYDMNLAEAVGGARQHHQWMPDQLQLERANYPQYAPLVEQLRKMGHRVVPVTSQGDAHSIQRDPKTGILTGVADNRRSGKATAAE